MSSKLADFFEQFAKDVSTFDGELIASKYLAPYLAVSEDGAMWECREREDVVDYFQNLLDKHRANGVTQCKYEDLVSSPVGPKGHFATVSWTMMDDEGKAISHWRESYNMLDTDDGLKIFVSMDH